MEHEKHEGDGWLGSWCAQCGPEVSVDADGLCSHCGATAVGDGADEAITLLRKASGSRAEIFTWRIGFVVLVVLRVIIWLSWGG